MKKQYKRPLDDWRTQNALLHIHDNYKFQSVYTEHPQPVVEQIEANNHYADIIIFAMACAILGAVGALAILVLGVDYLPGLHTWWRA
jgi:hypothetical protein